MLCFSLLYCLFCKIGGLNPKKPTEKEDFLQKIPIFYNINKHAYISNSYEFFSIISHLKRNSKLAAKSKLRYPLSLPGERRGSVFKDFGVGTGNKNINVIRTFFRGASFQAYCLTTLRIYRTPKIESVRLHCKVELGATEMETD